MMHTRIQFHCYHPCQYTSKSLTCTPPRTALDLHLPSIPVHKCLSHRQLSWYRSSPELSRSSIQSVKSPVIKLQVSKASVQPLLCDCRLLTLDGRMVLAMFIYFCICLLLEQSQVTAKVHLLRILFLC